MCFDAALTASHRSGSASDGQSLERPQHECLPLAGRQFANRDFEALHRLLRLQLLVRSAAFRIRCRSNNIVVIIFNARTSEPHHHAISHELPAMPVADPVLQNPIKKRRPFVAAAICIFPRQFDHRILAISTFVLIVVYWIRIRKTELPARVAKGVNALLHTAVLQVALGIATLLLVVPVILAATHQAVAMLLITVALYLCHGLRRT